MTLVIGLISGTSVDGIDAALVDISGADTDLNVELLAGETYPYPAPLKAQILAVCAGEAISVAQLAALDDAIAFNFAQAAQNIQFNHAPAQLIGSHGQTVYHRPPNGSRAHLGYSLQLGRGEVITQLTQIPTVSNFRAADIAAGGHGAPLVSKIDVYLLSDQFKSRCVQNLGGIGNLTYIPARNRYPNWLEKIQGWDTGPGNTLLDLAVQHFSKGVQSYDVDGNWAASGTICNELVAKWLSQDYFQQPPPKSTGRELFGWEYLHQCLTDAAEFQLESADMLATLTELTVSSIVHSYCTFLPQLPASVLLCGGGSRNLYLKHRLQQQLESVSVLTTDAAGLSADFKEAIAFAVLAYWRQLQIPGNLPQVTGARQPVLLGDVHSISE